MIFVGASIPTAHVLLLRNPRRVTIAEHDIRACGAVVVSRIGIIIVPPISYAEIRIIRVIQDPEF